MTEQDLRRIETAIGRPLSLPFRQFYLNPPSELGRVTGLLVDADDIISMNHGGLTTDWPANHLALGENGCGDVYSTNLDDDCGAIYLSGPHSGFDSPEETGYFERVFESLQEFFQHLIRIREGQNE